MYLKKSRGLVQKKIQWREIYYINLNYLILVKSSLDRPPELHTGVKAPY
ncbi:MAG: hypothetical protein N5P05_000374 [Chroococcopsis gigantea SAG 12.99]|jgi:type VI protein secretion system component VasA|nr:hypothetical protein [Chroococcopsis gigantea SAG 12.99]